MQDEIRTKTASTLAAPITRRQMAAVEMVEAHLQRVRDANGGVNAVTRVFDAGAAHDGSIPGALRPCG